MPEAKKKQKTQSLKSKPQINGNSQNGHSIKIDTREKIREEEIQVLEFELVNKDLLSISSNFFLRYCNLFKLNLSGNKLSLLPSAINSLVNLEYLVLDNNRFSEFPLVLEGLTNLKDLSIANNKMYKFPEKSFGLLSVEKLNLSRNELRELPIIWRNMENLKELDVSYNYLKFIPSCVEQGMPVLEMLNCSNNNICIDGLVYSYRIKKFYCRNNKHPQSRFPKWIFCGKYYKFEELNFENSPFDLMMIPANPKIQVKVLDVQRCNFTSNHIGALLQDIESVEYLKIGNNEYSFQGNLFQVLPFELMNSPQDLLEIHSQSVGLSTISPAIKNFINITKIDFSRNHISWLPDEFCCLKKLQVLLLSHNSLIMLPENIGKLESLRELDIASNYIFSLPNSLSELKSLQYLDLYFNDLNEWPESLNDLENLLGFDVEQNIVDSNNCQLSTYKKLCESLRGYSKIESRLNGPKPKPLNLSDSSFSSSRSSIESFSNVSNNSASMLRECSPENWDKDSDSLDDFDPYDRQPIIEKEFYLNRYMFGNPMFFCPDDLHVTRVKDIIAQKYNLSLYPLRPQIVEGQFDDAD